MSINNHVQLNGNLVRDPELRYVTGGSVEVAVVNLTIAVSRFYKSSDGENKKTTDFVDCVAWHKGAETICNLFKKGDPMLLHGLLYNERWKTSEGENRSKLCVRIESFQKLPRLRREENQDETSPETVAVGGDDNGNGEDVPF